MRASFSVAPSRRSASTRARPSSGGGAPAVVLVDLAGHVGLGALGVVERPPGGVQGLDRRRRARGRRSRPGPGPRRGRPGGPTLLATHPPAGRAEAVAVPGDDDGLGVGHGGVGGHGPAPVDGHGRADERVEHGVDLGPTGPDVAAERPRPPRRASAGGPIEGRRAGPHRCARRRAGATMARRAAATSATTTVPAPRRPRPRRRPASRRRPRWLEQRAEHAVDAARRSAPARERASSRARARASARADQRWRSASARRRASSARLRSCSARPRACSASSRASMSGTLGLDDPLELDGAGARRRRRGARRWRPARPGGPPAGSARWCRARCRPGRATSSPRASAARPSVSVSVSAARRSKAARSGLQRGGRLGQALSSGARRSTSAAGVGQLLAQGGGLGLQGGDDALVDERQRAPARCPGPAR